MNRNGRRADTPGVPYQPESGYFVTLDAPPPPSRQTPRERPQHWSDHETRPVPAHRRRRRKIKIRPVGVLVLAVLSWVGWAYTTPGGPSARINDWIDKTRGDVEQASANPNLKQAAAYFNGLYASQGSYPDLSDTAIREDSKAGFGLGTNFIWCNGRAVIVQNLSSGGILSRLLLDGQDLGNVANARGCPANLGNPAPWKLKNAAS